MLGERGDLLGERGKSCVEGGGTDSAGEQVSRGHDQVDGGGLGDDETVRWEMGGLERLVGLITYIAAHFRFEGDEAGAAEDDGAVRSAAGSTCGELFHDGEE